MQDEALLRRDKIIDAVGAAAERFLRASNWQLVVDDVLRLIGEATDADRVQVYENDFDDQGQILVSMRFEWVSPGIEPVIGRDEEQNFPMDDGGFSRWVEVLRDAGVVQGPLDTLPAAEREFLEAEGVQSVLAVPIFFEDRWWGWIGLDDCAAPRVWASAEVDAVRAIAGIIGAAGTRERMEHRARDSEAKYRTLVEHLPAVTYIATGDESTATLYISPQVQDLLGYSAGEWLKRRGIWSELVHPDDRPRVFAQARETSVTGDPFRSEYRMLPRYGGQVWVLEEAVLVRDQEGKPKYWQGMMLDITAQKTAESQAAAAELRYQALIEQVPAMIYTEDLRGAVSVTYISPRAEVVLGFPVERWLEDPEFWLGQVHPGDRARVSAEVARADSEGATTFESEYRIFTADGAELWFRDEASLVRDEDGAPVCWQGMMLDVTEQKEASQRLAEAEDQFRTLVEQSPGITYVEALVTEDEEVGALLYISPQIEQVLGYPSAKWLEDPRFWDTVVHDDDWPEMDAAYDEAMIEGTPVHMEYRVLTADGRWRWMHDESQVVLNGEGKPRFWQGIMHDITDQKAADDRMRQAEERYRSLVEQIPSAAYTVALDGLGKSLYMSPRIEAMLGTPAQEWVANERLWEEMLHPDDREEMTKQGEAARDAGIEFNVEYRMVARDGRTVWIHDQARLMRDDSGEPLF